MTSPVLIVHGGAGAIDRARLGPDRDACARAGLGTALSAGHAILAGGGSALAAVEAAVRVLEDDPSFNAGRGCALTSDGRAELDAAIMDGSDGRAGAVACVSCLRNPVHAARLVMERTPHVLLAGPGAESFAIAHGAAHAAQEWLVTDKAREDLALVLAKRPPPTRGTVGAVALDGAGRLAAATSTGGVTGKLPGRVGDCPLIGSGTWADELCAISATGKGEAFIRVAFAHSVAGMIAGGTAPDEAARRGLELVRRRDGDGGCIVLHRDGRVAMVQDADMFRGTIGADGRARVAIFGTEEC